MRECKSTKKETTWKTRLLVNTHLQAWWVKYCREKERNGSNETRYNVLNDAPYAASIGYCAVAIHVSHHCQEEKRSVNALRARAPAGMPEKVI